jgi:iron complex outermembrane receptor protein
MKFEKFLFFIFILLLHLVRPALSQDNIPASNFLIKTADKALFQEIPSVYTASKYEQKVTKAPASVSIVTADEIKKWGYRNFGEIIASLKGFYSTYDRNYGYVGARGFGLPSDYNSRILLLVDGHRYNENVFESFTVDENFPIDIDMIERVEVVRGPSSSLYGTSAVFGVINVITKRGRDQEGGNVKTSYGSFDATKTSLSYGKRFRNGLEAFIGGSFYYSNGNDHFFSKEFLNPINDINHSVNRGYYDDNDDEEAKKLLGKLTYGDITLEGLIVERKKNIPTAPFLTRFNDPDTSTKDQAYFFDIKYDHTFENQLNLQARFSYNYYRYYGNYPSFDTLKRGDYDNKDMSRGQWWRGNIEATKIFWDNHKLTFGGEFQHDFDQFQTNFDLISNGSTIKNGFNESSAYRWALYAQDEYSITDNLTFNAGLRYDYFSTFGDTINPRLALIYNPWESTTFKVLYGTAFRAPSAFEKNASVIPLIPNDELQPEHFESTELIIEHYFNNHLRGEFNLFHTEISDIIAQVNINNDKGNTQNQNVDNVRSNGFEVQIEDNWNNGFQTRLSYSWQDTKYISTNTRLPNSPEHLIKLNLIAPIWEDKVFLGFETRYMSNRKRQLLDSNSNSFIYKQIGDNVISNLTIFTKNWVKGLELSAGLYNLFDERFFDPGATEHTQIGIQQDGLTFRTKTPAGPPPRSATPS